MKLHSLSKLWEVVKDREAQHAAVYGAAKIEHDLVTEQQQVKLHTFHLLIECYFIQQPCSMHSCSNLLRLVPNENLKI